MSNIRSMLKDEGYHIVDMDDNVRNVDAVILTGMDEDLMGMEETMTDGFILDATGRQPEEILYDLEKHFRLLEE